MISRGSAASLVVVAVVSAVAVRAAQAISWRDDRQDANCLAEGSKHPNVGAVYIPYDPVLGPHGSGTLISDVWVLTAAHVAEDLFLMDLLPRSRFVLNGECYGVSGAVIYEGWLTHPGTELEKSNAGLDIALLKLARPVTGVTPAPLNVHPWELGDQVTIVGFGAFGPGDEPNVPSDGQRRAGSNTIDEICESPECDGRRLLADFDSPNASGRFANQMGSPGPTWLECGIRPGDSGGAWFWRAEDTYYLYGVSVGSSGDGYYNTVQSATRVSSYQGWIQRAMCSHEMIWSRTGSGRFCDEQSWACTEGGQYLGMPGLGDTAIFYGCGQPGPYEVTFDAHLPQVTNQALVVRYEADVSLALEGCTYTLTGPATIGKETAYSASLVVGGGVFSAPEVTVGDPCCPWASMQQISGSVLVSQCLYLGREAGAQGAYSLDGGRLEANTVFVGDSGTGHFSLKGGALEANTVFVGQGGTGYFTHTDGNHTAASLCIGTWPGSQGTYELGGGRLTVLEDEEIGGAGVGTFVQTGGDHTARSLYVGRWAGWRSTYTMRGGTLTVETLRLGCSPGVAGTLELAAGTGDPPILHITDDGVLSLGGDAMEACGILTQSAGQVQAPNADVYVGDGAPRGYGSYTLSGGSLTAARLIVGRHGEGQFIQYDGVVSTRITIVGHESGKDNRYLQRGGTHIVSETLQLGVAAGSKGRYELDGNLSTPETVVGNHGAGEFLHRSGTHAVAGELSLGLGLGATGSYALEGGRLSADVIRVGGLGTASLKWTGGTLEANEIRIGSNGQMNLNREWTYEGALEIDGGKLVASDWPDWPRRITLTNGATARLTSGSISGYQLHVVATGDDSAFVQEGGDVTMSGPELAPAAGVWTERVAGPIAQPVYELRGGRLSAPVVWVGSGTFRQTGGTNEVDWLEVGVTGPDCRYELGGTGQIRAAAVAVGPNGGTGTLTQEGDTSVVCSILWLGCTEGGTGSYEISDGLLNISEYLWAGRDSRAVLRITGPAADIRVGKTLELNEDLVFTAIPGATIHMMGAQLDNRSTDPWALSGLRNLTLVYEVGAASTGTLEVAGENVGLTEAGWLDNFALGGLVVRAGALVRLTDSIANQNAVHQPEALYLDELTIEPGGWIDLDGLNLYYRNGGEPKRLYYADTDLDGDVDFLDYLQVKGAFGALGVATWALGDTDGDGDVDFFDYLTAKVNFGSGPGGMGVHALGNGSLPEPAALVLLAVGGAWLASRRRQRRGGGR